MARLLFLFILLGVESATAQTSLGPTDEVQFNFPAQRNRMTLYNQPGLDWIECRVNSKDCAGKAAAWPDNNAQVKLINQKGRPLREVRRVENYYGETEERSYYQVQVDYASRGADGVTRFNTSVVWVEDKFLLRKNELNDQAKIRQLDLAPKPKIRTEKPCPPSEAASAPVDRRTRNQLGDIADATQRQVQGSLKRVSDLIAPHVGKCAIQPPLRKNPGWDLNKTIYDQSALRLLNLRNVPQAQIRQNLGRNLSREDLINIDVLARTLYSEMGRCYDDGPQYPLGVAKVILNRTEFLEKNGFNQCWADRRPFQDPFRVWDTRGDEGRPAMSQVITAKDQFSVWNPRIGNQFNYQGLQQALCPPAQGQNHYWKTENGRKIPVPDFEREIWKDSIEIATQAVLYPQKFQARTRDINNIYFYTSGIPNFMGLRRVTLKADGKGIVAGRCLNLFEARIGTQVRRNLDDSSSRAKVACR
ncbi:MAG: hypothetical protein ACK5P6_08600 [Pseudobdellovibrionaceae bacterium]